MQSQGLTDVPSPYQEGKFTIQPEHNLLVMKLSGHSWVSIFSNDQEIYRSESPDPILSFVLSPETYKVRTDGQIGELNSEKVDLPNLFFEQLQQQQPSVLRITSDAPDQHIVDGIGEVPADGTSFCTISISKYSLDGTPLTDEEHQDELFLRTTGGLIMDATGETHIRSLHLQSGQAAFRLVSEASPKLVTISVFGQNPSLTKAEIQIEFI